MSITMNIFLELSIVPLLLLLMPVSGEAGNLVLPEGPPWYFGFKLVLPNNLNTTYDILKLQFNHSNTTITVSKNSPKGYKLKYTVEVNGIKTENEMRSSSKIISLGISVDKSSIGIWLEQDEKKKGEIMAQSPVEALRNVQFEFEEDVQFSGQVTPMNKTLDETIMKNCFIPQPKRVTSPQTQSMVTCPPTKEITPEDNIISTTTLIERQTVNFDETNSASYFSTLDNSKDQITDRVSEKTKDQSEIKSEKLTTETECGIPGYIWALLGLTSILAFLFIPLLIYAIRISKRYHKVCIKLESWKNHGESKLPPYLDMSQNTLRRPQPLQPQLISDVNSLSSSTTPPQTPLSTESAFSSHLFDSNPSTLPRPGHGRTASITSNTYSPTKNIDSTNGYSSLKRSDSVKSYTNPSMSKNPVSTANMPQFSTPPPPLEEMEEEAADRTKQNDMFIFRM